jgi:CRP/FNR family transcriptional regulator, cyclic AMP receptor protein
MGESDLVTTLSSVDLFQGLSAKVLGRIAEAGHVAEYPAGTKVIAQGDSVEGFKAFSPAGVEMHVILSGVARVDINGEQHALLGPGSYFGEISLIDGRPRSADVVADGDGLRTLALSKWTFEDLLEKHPEIAVPMLRVLAARLRADEEPASDPA